VTGTLPVDLSTTTGTATKNLSSSSPFCKGTPGARCMCDTCNNAAATPCSTNSDCAAVGATICGGKRCLGGGNNGNACSADSECPSALCNTIGEPTKPNGCLGGICSPVTANEGECAAGPVSEFCSGTTIECSSNTDCAGLTSCAGGTHDGQVCHGAPDCPGGACGPAPCVGQARKCYLDNGVIGGSIDAFGMASVPVNDAADPTLASLFCLRPVASSSINSAAGLPGLARLELMGHVQGQP